LIIMMLSLSAVALLTGKHNIVRAAMGLPQRTSSAIVPLGYLFTGELPGGLGTTGGQIAPKEPAQRFVVVVVSLPRKLLIPSESEYEAMKENWQAKEKPARENVLVFRPSRFRIIPASGGEVAAGLIADWEMAQNGGFGGGFCPGTLIQSRSGTAKAESVPETLQVAVAAAVGSESRAPLRIRIDDQPPLDVPEKQLPQPPRGAGPFVPPIIPRIDIPQFNITPRIDIPPPNIQIPTPRIPVPRLIPEPVRPNQRPLPVHPVPLPMPPEDTQAQAEKLAAEASAAEERKDYARAIPLYERCLKAYPNGARRDEIDRRLSKLRSDPEIQKSVKAQEADTRCQSLITTAENYLENRMVDKAQECLETIIAVYPDSRWARIARERLDGITAAKAGK
jgi:hypothetical protein